MEENKIQGTVELPKVLNELVVNGSLRPSITQMIILNDIKHYLSLRDILKKNGISYKETFSFISKKDSLHVIMALTAYYDLKLHQMDVKIAFLNGNVEEKVYIDQLEGFPIERKGHIMCKLKKLIYGLKQASRQWYIKFNDTITSFSFEENPINRCIY